MIHRADKSDSSIKLNLTQQEDDTSGSSTVRNYSYQREIREKERQRGRKGGKEGGRQERVEARERKQERG